MKKLYISTLFLLITLGVFGQYSISFNDTLRPFGSGAYALKNIIEDSNNYYISGTFNSSVGQYPFLLKANAYGSIDIKRLYNDTIYGSTGKSIFSQKLESGIKFKNVSIKCFKKGVYYIKLSAENKIIGTGKFVKK